MKKLLSVFASLILVLSLTGCNAAAAAATVSRVINGVVSVAEADLPALEAAGSFSKAEGDAVDHYLKFGLALNSQFGVCAGASGNTKAKLVACLNAFSTGLADPNELSALRILSPNAQKQVQLYIVAFQVAINTALASFGAQAPAAPQVASAPVKSADLQEFKGRVMFALGR
jgi:hypothetical protein